MVRRLRAMRPCRPMIFPTSFSATCNSTTIWPGSSKASALTSSGASTSALASSVINAGISGAFAIDKFPVLRRSRLWSAGRSGSAGRSLVHQLLYPVRHLRALARPISDALALKKDGCGLCPWVVSAHHFHRAAVTCAVLLDDNNTVMRLLARTTARETNHQHREYFLSCDSKGSDPVRVQTTLRK